MVEVVPETSVLDRFVGLLTECNDFIIVTIQFRLFDCQVFIYCFELESIVERFDVGLLYFALIQIFVFVFRCRDIWVLFASSIFESHTVSNLKDFRMV